MEWGNAAGWVAAFIGFLAVNASTIQWLLKRRDEQRQRDSGRVDDLEKQLVELRVDIYTPPQYVRREDSDQVQRHPRRQLDAMREEVREQIAEVKERLYAGQNDLEQKNREEARWRMLRVVDAGRPIAVSEQMIWRVLADIKLSLSLNTVRRELAYLRDLVCSNFRKARPSETWFAKLTASGVDVVEYNSPSPAGVARPRKYW